ncbi:MAG TPA: chemotaxis protein CheB [Solirubrobacterales bacterium]|nr:chemotaxis protein CheB [Solirubrobacterales bacterium]
MATRARQIVICERSAGQARALARFLERDSDIDVIAVCGDSSELLKRLDELEPDLVALDLETIGVGAASTIEQIMRARPVPILILGGREGEDSERVAEALAAGALEALPREKLCLDEPEGIWATALRSRVKRLASLQLKRRDAKKHGASTPPRAWRKPGTVYRAIGIGASVGGPPALAAVLGGLPRDFPLPVLVVQHMAAGFGEGLAKWLDENTSISVRLAVDGAPLQAGVWIAPDDAHLRLEPSMRLSLDRKTRQGAHRPSLDVLFESLASSAGEGAVGVVLTGMGRDGAKGILELREAGGLTIAQDEESSAVFGMPGAAIEVGVDLVLPLEELAPKLTTLRAQSVAR